MTVCWAARYCRALLEILPSQIIKMRTMRVFVMFVVQNVLFDSVYSRQQCYEGEFVINQMKVFLYECGCAYVHMHFQTNVWAYVSGCACIHICILLCVLICACWCVYICMYVCVWYLTGRVLPWFYQQQQEHCHRQAQTLALSQHPVWWCDLLPRHPVRTMACNNMKQVILFSLIKQKLLIYIYHIPDVKHHIFWMKLKIECNAILCILYTKHVDM